MWEVRRVEPAVYLIVLRMKEIILVKLWAPWLTETPGWVKCHTCHLVFCSTRYILLLPYELNRANQWGLFTPWIRVCSLSMEGIFTKAVKTLADQAFISGLVLAQMKDWGVIEARLAGQIALCSWTLHEVFWVLLVREASFFSFTLSQ